jgi:oligo-1,6-glucosidase
MLTDTQKQEVVYQIYPRSFMDTNADGTGDIKGITQKLGYLKDLGVNAIWLSPIYKSPDQDNGYDISDYYEIDPRYGTMDDFKELIKQANAKKLRVIMDLVINHTSAEHEWFKKSKDKTSKYHDYYIWKEGKGHNTKPPNNWTSCFSGPAWEYDETAGKWYLHLFATGQPDLNYRNPAVIEEIKQIIDFWVNLGVGGFRCDVINQIYKTSFDDGAKDNFRVGIEHYINQEGNHKILKEIYAEKFKGRDLLLIGETDDIDYEDARKFTNEELNLVFAFDHMKCDQSHRLPLIRLPFNARRFSKITKGWQENFDWNTLYIENHDKKRVGRYIKKGFEQDGQKAYAVLLTTLRGTPFIYQGQEIGMTNSHFAENEIDDVAAVNVNNLIKNFKFIPRKARLALTDNINRDHARTPMQWDDTRNAGFSTGKPWLKVTENYKTINVKNEEQDPASILNCYKKLLNLRKNTPALIDGGIKFIESPAKALFYKRALDSEEYTIFVNISPKTVKVNIPFGTILFNTRQCIQEGKLLPYQAIIAKG